MAEELTDHAPEETDSEDSAGEADSPAGGVDSALPGKGAPKLNARKPFKKANPDKHPCRPSR